MKKLSDDWREELSGWWKEPLQIAPSCGAGNPLKYQRMGSGGGFAGEQFRGRQSEERLRVPPGRWGASPGAEGAGRPRGSSGLAPVPGAWCGAGLAIRGEAFGMGAVSGILAHRRQEIGIAAPP